MESQATESAFHRLSGSRRKQRRSGWPRRQCLDEGAPRTRRRSSSLDSFAVSSNAAGGRNGWYSGPSTCLGSTGPKPFDGGGLKPPICGPLPGAAGPPLPRPGGPGCVLMISLSGNSSSPGRMSPPPPPRATTDSPCCLPFGRQRLALPLSLAAQGAAETRCDKVAGMSSGECARCPMGKSESGQWVQAGYHKHSCAAHARACHSLKATRSLNRKASRPAPSAGPFRKNGRGRCRNQDRPRDVWEVRSRRRLLSTATAHYWVLGDGARMQV